LVAGGWRLPVGGCAAASGSCIIGVEVRCATKHVDPLRIFCVATKSASRRRELPAALRKYREACGLDAVEICCSTLAFGS
jgi:hypothetical protein